jgi:hypothetical protein
MKVYIFVFIFSLLSAQSLPSEWSQSYSTFDCAPVHVPGSYSLGFGIDNYALYGAEPDSVSYDTRRFDIFAHVGVFKNAELELKFSYPTNGIIAIKYLILNGWADASLKFGFSYMKGTRSSYMTDYVFDFYPTCIITKAISKGICIYVAPKIIYSMYPRDRQEHSDREPRNILQYGHGIGMMFGEEFQVMIEGNWLFGNNEGLHYTVNQYGIGVNALIH